MSERHVVPDRATGGGWKVVGAGSDGTEPQTDTQADAIDEAERELRHNGGGELLIHGINGQVCDKRLVQPQTEEA
ncbi:uncharacterized protein DUF2188 [Halopolyspora algeriensis]|uniref:Uncharacterized protein DUF2188 n=1 Tax=Halopolyspora algeriensis TaxID=1500506 RepID=A0A368VWE4_9ACTN|nr:DUF2188 domain-containing protein [Halopolyspora algeriensis]RCW46205.1 uncharacterized protein DUF2188 [Halopolyspora algeriensis]TQM55608.1 uncharacterized protein DUF2188 [Halopolyspora algeriensis]